MSSFLGYLVGKKSLEKTIEKVNQKLVEAEQQSQELTKLRASHRELQTKEGKTGRELTQKTTELNQEKEKFSTLQTEKNNASRELANLKQELTKITKKAQEQAQQLADKLTETEQSLDHERNCGIQRYQILQSLPARVEELKIKFEQLSKLAEIPPKPTTNFFSKKNCIIASALIVFLLSPLL